MAWYWKVLIVMGAFLVAYFVTITAFVDFGSERFRGTKAAGRRDKDTRKSIATRGQGLTIPWWFVPVFIIAYPFVAVSAFLKGRRKGNPHDISGEQDIPGGGRP